MSPGLPMSAEQAKSEPQTPAKSRAATIALLLVLFVSGALRLWLSWSEYGIYWPDEIYQSLEPAHRVAFGYGLRAWEFIDGARNWTFPALVAVVLKLASVLGADAPERYLWLLRMIFSGLCLVAAWGTYRLARAYKVDAPLAIAGAGLFALNAASLYFGHRAMSETASLPLLVWGFVFLVEQPEKHARVKLVLGASLLGLAVLVRLQNGLFCLGALGLLLGRKRFRDAGLVFGVLCAWAFVFGLIDKLTWGGWFHSAFKYIQFNVVEGKAAGWGTAPFSYYGRVAWTAMQGPSLVLLLSIPLAIRRAPAIALTCIAFVVLLGITPHKEFRFIVPVLPLVFALVAIGVNLLTELLTAPVLKKVLAVGLIVIALHSASRAKALTFGEIGAYEDQKPGASAWGDAANVNRLLVRAHHEPDLCGLKVEATHMAWAGGQSHFHRPVPLYSHVGPGRESRHYNYVITAPQWASGLVVIEQDGPVLLARLPGVSCVPDSNYNDRLP